ncbi:MAG: hypothetical protein WCO10_00860 [bacterium]
MTMNMSTVEVGIVTLIKTAEGRRGQIVNAPNDTIMMFSQYDNRRNQNRNSVFFSVENGTPAGEVVRVYISFAGSLDDGDLKYFTGYREDTSHVCGWFKLSNRRGEITFIS